MRSLHAFTCIAVAATAACVRHVPNPVDVAGVALDLTIHGIDEAARAASRAGRTTPVETPVPPAGAYPEGAYPAGAYPAGAYPAGAYPAGAYPVAVMPTPVPTVQARFGD